MHRAPLVIEVGPMRVVIALLRLPPPSARPSVCLQAASAAAADLPNAPSNYPALAPSAARRRVESVVRAFCRHGRLGLGRQGGQGRGRGRGLLGYDHAFDNGVVAGSAGLERLRAVPLVDPGGFTQFTGTALSPAARPSSATDGAGDALCDRRRRPRPPDPLRRGAFSPLDAVNTVFSGPGRGPGGRHGRRRRQLPDHPNFSMGVEAIVQPTPAAALRAVAVLARAGCFRPGEGYARRAALKLE